MATNSNYILMFVALFFKLILETNGQGAAVKAGIAAPAITPVTNALSPALGPAVSADGVFDITKNGAKPGTDATKALTDAWTAACASTKPSKVLIPKGNYSLGPFKVKGPCKAPITVEIGGNFKAPPDLAAFKGEDSWVKFEWVNDLTVTGLPDGAIFDGQGEQGWKNNKCLEKHLSNCFDLPYNFRFNSITKGKVTGITSMNSKLYHIAILGVKEFQMSDITIIAPADSPNTDGIHIARSDGVHVKGFTIGTGDDCVSFGDGSLNVLVENITCGPGHGLSVGSLGKYQKELPSKNITIRGCTLKNTDNGVRVKTWQNSFVTNVTGLYFEDITVENVRNPIIIDQEYCPWKNCKMTEPSKVKLTDIKFKNIKGTCLGKEAVKLLCSEGTPCEKIELAEINLTNKGPEGPAVSQCKFVKPILTGGMVPAACAAPATPATDAA